MALNIQDLCKQQGISLLELVDRTGLEMTRVQAIFQGRWTPGPEERAKIARVLGVADEDVAWGHVTPVQRIYGHGPG